MTDGSNRYQGFGEVNMHKSVLTAALLLGAIALPLAANAQGANSAPGVTTGSTGGRQADIAGRDAGQITGAIHVDQFSRFRRYVFEARIPSYAVSGDIQIGNTLPDAGVTYYDVPLSFGHTSYRFTVVNNRMVLVDPSTLRIVQVIE